MDFSASLAYVHSLGFELRPGRKFDLAEVSALLEALDRPQHAFSSVHIAGTNGKGSIAAMIESAARAAGIRTGLYTSPHLQRVRERIRIAGAEIVPEAFAAAATAVREVAESLLHQGRLPQPPSFFEVLTAIGFLAMAKAKVEVAVIETGMGGRLDATNVVQPLVAVITPVDMDHQAYLGSTLAAIAGEKAGIIKPSIAGVVVSPQSKDAMQILEAHCRATGVPLIAVEPRLQLATPASGGTWRMPMRYLDGTVELQPALPGRHQLENAAAAALACESLHRQGWNIPSDALQAGLRRVHWPGRLERVQSPPKPEVWLDGAHNPHAARALAAVLDAALERPVLVYASMQDKAIGEICELLFPRARAVVVTAPANPRAASPEWLRESFGHLAHRCEAAPDVKSALDAALHLATEEAPAAPVLVAGSLYLVGEARERWYPSAPPSTLAAASLEREALQ